MKGEKMEEDEVWEKLEELRKEINALDKKVKDFSVGMNYLYLRLLLIEALINVLKQIDNGIEVTTNEEC